MRSGSGEVNAGKVVSSGISWGVMIVGWTGVLIFAAIILLPFAFAPLLFFWQQEEQLLSHQVGELSGEIPFRKTINQAAKKYKVSPALIAAVIRQESNFDPDAHNRRTRATGLMQLVPGTAKEMGVKDAFHPTQNIMGGTKYLAFLLDRYDGNERLALAAYNGGLANVDKSLAKGGNGIPSFPETQKYVKNVMKYYDEYGAQVKNGALPTATMHLGKDTYSYRNGPPNQVDKWAFSQSNVLPMLRFD